MLFTQAPVHSADYATASRKIGANVPCTIRQAYTRPAMNNRDWPAGRSRR